MSIPGELPALSEHHLTTERTARVITAGGPDGSEPGLPEAWLVCHGYRQLASRFARRFLGIATPARRIVAPEGLSRFYVDPTPGRHGPESRVGASWMTRDDRLAEIRDYVHYLDRVAERFAQGAGRMVALGFSQGAHTAARWVALGWTRVDALILWGAYLPPDLDLSAARDRLSGVRMIQVLGDSDAARSAALEEAQDERLAEAELALTKVEYAGGHEIDHATLAGLAGDGPVRTPR